MQRATSAPAVLPPAPNYAQDRAWLSRPGAASFYGVPNGGGFSDLESRSNADVFYLYPTTAFAFDAIPRESGANAAYDDLFASGLAYEIGASQAGAFNGSGRIFAPYYRQVFMEEWLKKDPARASAAGSEVAYGDARRAFEYYMRHDNGGRPIVIVGHSQGSMLAFRLLKDEFDGKPLYTQLVAAYIPGQAVDRGFYRNFVQVHACTSAIDTGCVNSWGSFQQGIPTQDLLDFIGVSPYFTTGNGGYRVPAPPVEASVNLVSWNRAPASSPRSSDLGPLQMRIPYPPLYFPHAPRHAYPMGKILAMGFSSRTLGAAHQPEAVGFFVAPKPSVRDFSAYVPSWFPSSALYNVNFAGVWHLYDFNLFWTNIRQNARDRTNAYLHAHGERRPLIAGPVRLVVSAGTPLAYHIATVNSASTFGADGLPPPLKLDAKSGLISGRPKAGTSAIVLRATNASGTSFGELALVVR